MASVRRTRASFLMLTAIFAGAAVAAAQRIDPHTPVASDGKVVPRLQMESSVPGEDAFAGVGPELESATATFEETGALIDGAEEVVESAQDVWAMWEAGASAINLVRGGSVIGTDTRALVNPTTTYPARAIVLITFDAGRCTGWLYGKDIVATAGHCVHSGGSGGKWQTNVRVYPGRNGSSSPYGSCTARRLHSVTGWTQSKDERYDYGAIKLNCTIGNTTGWFGYWYQGASLTGLPATVAGYPGERPLTQWKGSASISVTQERQVFYTIDTTGGQSGAPVYYNRPAGSAACTGPCSMAIHAYGLHGSSPHKTNNHATRITRAVFDNLFSWKNTP